MTTTLLREPDADPVFLAAWRADILSVPFPPMPKLDRAVRALSGSHMPTVAVLRVVQPRFPRFAASVRWATTVGAILVATACLASALLLVIGMRLGVLQP